MDSHWFSQVYSAARNLEGLQSENEGQGWKRVRHACGQIFCDTLPGQENDGNNERGEVERLEKFDHGYRILRAAVARNLG